MFSKTDAPLLRWLQLENERGIYSILYKIVRLIDVFVVLLFNYWTKVQFQTSYIMSICINDLCFSNQLRGSNVAHFHLLNIKASKLSHFELIWFLSSIIFLISSMMCLAITVLALVLPGENLVMLWLAIASLSFGLVGYASIKVLHRRQNAQQWYS